MTQRTRTDVQMTEDYADEIVRRLEAIERLTDTDCTDPDGLLELSTEDLDTLAELIEADTPPRRAGRTNVEGVGLEDTLAEHYQDWLDDRGTDPAGAWLNDALDITLIGERSLSVNEWTITETRVVVTIGGPNAYVIERGSDWLYVEVYWGGDEARRTVHAPNISQRIDEYVEGLKDIDS